MPRCPTCYRRLDEGAACPRDGGVARAPEEAPITARDSTAPEVPGYAIQGLLGGGGFAFVWAARRIADGAALALKVGRMEGNAQLARFLLEANVLKRLGPPAAPRWIDDGALADGRPFIAMERIEGETLAKRLARAAEPPSVAWIERVAGAVLDALAALHAQGFAHRDLKPENVVLAEGDRVVLLDYGLTKPIAGGVFTLEWPKLTRTGVAVGTPEYMAPEQIRAESAALAQTDLYAFGVLLFELFTLRVPFTGERGSLEHAHLQRRPPRPSDLAFVPRAFEALILSCLAKEPERRPASAETARRALREAAAEADEAAAESCAPQSGPRSQGAPQSARALPRLLGEGRHPAVILVVHRAGPAFPVVAAVKAKRGHVVRHHGSRFVALFSAFDTDHPAQAAVSAARELCDLGARAALHLDTVTIRRKDRGSPAVYGASVERPEAWMPAEPWSGLFLSEELRRVLLAEKARAEASTDEAPRRSSDGRDGRDGRDGSEASEAREAGALGASQADEPPMMGRTALQTAIEERFADAFNEGKPRLLTLIGDAGIGKTRLASEAASSVQAAHPDALVVTLRAPPPGVGDGLAEGAALLRSLLDLPAKAPEDAEGFWARALGEELGAAAAPFAGALVGYASPPPGDGSVMQMRALAEAMRRRASRGPVAVILDDAHHANDALLDALEVATLGGDALPLCVMVAATPAFERVRRAWGSRTRFYDRMLVGPLETEAAMDLAAELLRPAEYPPRAVLERLSLWAGGNPFCLKEVVRAIKRAGIVRRRPNGGSYYITTTNLESLPPLPAWQWLAARWLDAMPPELAACVRLCSVLGAAFTRAEAEEVQDALDRAGDPSTPLDMGFALRSLVERQIFESGGEGSLFSFRNEALKEAVYEMLEVSQRRTVHLRALELVRARAAANGGLSASDLERRGRHATAIGARAEAAEAYLALGHLGRANHKDTEADRAYTLALNEAAEDDGRTRSRALLGRGRSRYRVARVREALDDFQGARALAEALEDPKLHAETLLEEATALDWHREYEASAVAVASARPLVEATEASALHARLLMAEGRTTNRKGKTAESIALLARAASEARDAGDTEARVVSLLLLAFGLAAAGDLDASEARFEEVIALATATDDRPHLCAAYSNRIILWFNRRQPSRAVDDLRRSIALARELGNPWLERIATYNVTVLLHWSGEWQEARAHADRVRFLEERFFEKPSTATSLLLVRILMALEERSLARSLFAWVRATCPPGNATQSGGLWSYRMVQLALDGAADPGANAGATATATTAATWDDVVRGAADDGLGESIVEALYWRARVALEAGRIAEARRALDEAADRRHACPLWPSRFEALERRANQAA